MSLLKENIPDDQVFYESKLPAFFSPISKMEAIRLACSCALQGMGRVSPNPMVGAVLVDQKHRFIAAACHLEWQKKHAEANLLEDLKKRGLESFLTGGTLYCTLEPCAHQGKNPSCAKLLAKTALAEVIIAASDPFEKVNGKGLKILNAAGLKTKICQEFSEKAVELNRIFFHSLSSARPFIGLKLAASLDGVYAYKDKSIWITSKRARNYGHWLRQYYDSVLIGADTLICDNPSLTVRSEFIAKPRTPLRIVFDPSLRALNSRPLAAHKLLNSEPEKTLWVASEKICCEKEKRQLLARLEERGASVLLLPYSKEEGFKFESFFCFLKEKSILSLLLEGGKGVWTSFLEKKLIDKLHFFTSPSFLQNSESQSFFSDQLSEHLKLSKPYMSRFQEDWVLESLIRKD